MFAILLSVASAFAVDHEISAEIGTLRVGDPEFALFSNGEALPSVGLRGVFAAHERVGIAVGWHHAGRGTQVDSPSGDFRAALLADEFTLGAKSDVRIGSALSLYAEGDLLLLRGAVRFDDDPDADDNPGEVSKADVAPGLLALGGVEFRIPQGEAPFTLALHLAAGYGTTFGPLAWEGIGEIQPGGFVLRSGVGVRF